MHVILGSTSSVKQNAVTAAFQSVFPNDLTTLEGIAVVSDVPDQPMSHAETRRGAHNRALAAKAIRPDADFWVGVEGGIEAIPEGMTCFGWVVVIGAEGTTGYGQSGSFLLPPKVVELIAGGMELGDADNVVFGRSDSKQTNGAVGILTNDLVTRADLYKTPTIFALIPFVKKELYEK